MTHRRTHAALGLALVLVVGGACGVGPVGRSGLGTSPHRAGSAPIAPGQPTALPAPGSGRPSSPLLPATAGGAGPAAVSATATGTLGSTLSPVPIDPDDFSVKLTIDSTFEAYCAWQRGFGGVLVDVKFTLAHTGGIPGHGPTSVSLHLVDGDGRRSPTYTSGFGSAYFGMPEPAATEAHLVGVTAVLDLSAPDADASDDVSFEALAEVPGGVPVGFGIHPLTCL
jgi:hypothetical protein